MATKRAEVCAQCDGGGEVAWNPSHIGDPQGPSERLRERVITAVDIEARNTALEALRRAQAACERVQP